MYRAMVSFNDKLFSALKKILVPLSIFGILGFAIFAYLNNIEIDEGTAEMFATINGLFVLFCVLGSLSFIVLCLIIHLIV